MNSGEKAIKAWNDPLILAERLMELLDKQGYKTEVEVEVDGVVRKIRAVDINHHHTTKSFIIQNISNYWKLEKEKEYK